MINNTLSLQEINKPTVMIYNIYDQNQTEILLVAYPAAGFLVKEFQKFGYNLIIMDNIKGKPIATATKFTSKMKYPKTDFNYSFSSKISRAKYLAEKLQELYKWEKRKADKKTVAAAARADFKNPFTVGQIFYDSWGYDQTNVDFYQITEVKAKSVILREIAGTLVGDSRVKPSPDHFVGEPKLKPIQIRVNSQGESWSYINGDRGSISLYCNGDAGLYYSSYH